jgi:hypothetical protein
MYDDCITDVKEKIADNALEKQQLHDVTTLAAELRRLLVRHHDVLKAEGVRKEMERLEDWLETERKGPAPAGIISESGVTWLKNMRDKLKLSAEEAQRLEGEGGNPSSQEQANRNEDLLKTIRRIDEIINENSAVKTH